MCSKWWMWRNLKDGEARVEKFLGQVSSWNWSHEIINTYYSKGHNWAGNVSANSNRETIDLTDIHWDTVLVAGNITLNKAMPSQSLHLKGNLQSIYEDSPLK